MSEGMVANKATVKVLGAKEGVVCVGVVFKKLMLDFESKMREGIDDDKIKEFFTNWHPKEKEEIISFLKKEHGLSDDDCSFVMNNLNPQGTLANAIIKMDGQKTFAQAVEYLKGLGYAEHFMTFEDFAKILLSL